MSLQEINNGLMAALMASQRRLIELENTVQQQQVAAAAAVVIAPAVAEEPGKKKGKRASSVSAEPKKKKDKTAYNLYVADRMKVLKKVNLVSQEWKSLSEEEKASYQRRADECKTPAEA